MNEDGTCPIKGCDYTCKSRKQSTFAMHVTCKHKELSGNSVHTYTCLRCSLSFSSRAILNQHEERVHNPWKYGCKTCGHISANKSAALIHHVSIHLHMKDRDCVDENGCCINCAKKLPRTGHKNHYARCIGIVLEWMNEETGGGVRGYLKKRFFYQKIDSFYSSNHFFHKHEKLIPTSLWIRQWWRRNGPCANHENETTGTRLLERTTARKKHEMGWLVWRRRHL